MESDGSDDIDILDDLLEESSGIGGTPANRKPDARAVRAAGDDDMSFGLDGILDDDFLGMDSGKGSKPKGNTAANNVPGRSQAPPAPPVPPTPMGGFRPGSSNSTSRSGSGSRTLGGVLSALGNAASGSGSDITLGDVSIPTLGTSNERDTQQQQQTYMAGQPTGGITQASHQPVGRGMPSNQAAQPGQPQRQQYNQQQQQQFQQTQVQGQTVPGPTSSFASKFAQLTATLHNPPAPQLQQAVQAMQPMQHTLTPTAIPTPAFALTQRDGGVQRQAQGMARPTGAVAGAGGMAASPQGPSDDGETRETTRRILALLEQELGSVGVQGTQGTQERVTGERPKSTIAGSLAALEAAAAATALEHKQQQQQGHAVHTVLDKLQASLEATQSQVGRQLDTCDSGFRRVNQVLDSIKDSLASVTQGMLLVARTNGGGANGTGEAERSMAAQQAQAQALQTLQAAAADIKEKLGAATERLVETVRSSAAASAAAERERLRAGGILDDGGMDTAADSPARAVREIRELLLLFSPLVAKLDRLDGVEDRVNSVAASLTRLARQVNMSSAIATAVGYRGDGLAGLGAQGVPYPSVISPTANTANTANTIPIPQGSQGPNNTNNINNSYVALSHFRDYLREYDSIISQREKLAYETYYKGKRMLNKACTLIRRIRYAVGGEGDREGDRDRGCLAEALDECLADADVAAAVAGSGVGVGGGGGGGGVSVIDINDVGRGEMETLQRGCSGASLPLLSNLHMPLCYPHTLRQQGTASQHTGPGREGETRETREISVNSYNFDDINDVVLDRANNVVHLHQTLSPSPVTTTNTASNSTGRAGSLPRPVRASRGVAAAVAAGTTSLPMQGTAFYPPRASGAHRTQGLGSSLAQQPLDTQGSSGQGSERLLKMLNEINRKNRLLLDGQTSFISTSAHQSTASTQGYQGYQGYQGISFADTSLRVDSAGGGSVGVSGGAQPPAVPTKWMSQLSHPQPLRPQGGVTFLSEQTASPGLGLGGVSAGSRTDRADRTELRTPSASFEQLNVDGDRAPAGNGNGNMEGEGETDREREEFFDIQNPGDRQQPSNMRRNQERYMNYLSLQQRQSAPQVTASQSQFSNVAQMADTNTNTNNNNNGKYTGNHITTTSPQTNATTFKTEGFDAITEFDVDDSEPV